MGRRPLLMIAFAALAARGTLLRRSTIRRCWSLCRCWMASRLRSSACTIPLIVADVAFGSGHFNLAQGIIGTATGIGASLSNVVGGYVSDHFGHGIAFLQSAAVAILGLLVVGSSCRKPRLAEGAKQGS